MSRIRFSGFVGRCNAMQVQHMLDSIIADLSSPKIVDLKRHTSTRYLLVLLAGH